jgi:hypothetical protein
MCRARTILGFLGRFVIVFGLLTAPWPGWPEIYARCVRKTATAVYGTFGSEGIVQFAPNPSGEKTVDTIIYVRNREKLGADEPGTVGSHEFDCRVGAYFPTALVIALVLATQISWRRRLAALGWGICDRPSLGLFAVSPFWRRVVSFWYEIFIALLGGRYAAAVLIWILVSIRRDDWITLLRLGEAGVSKSSGLTRAR